MTNTDLAPGTVYRCLLTGSVHKLHGLAYNRVTMQHMVVHEGEGMALLYLDTLASFARDFEKLPVERHIDLREKGSGA
jgi:hypothetical protein